MFVTDLTQLTSPTFSAYFTAGPLDRPLQAKETWEHQWLKMDLAFVFFYWHHLRSAEIAEPLSFSTEQEHEKMSMIGLKLSLAGEVLQLDSSLFKK